MQRTDANVRALMPMKRVHSQIIGMCLLMLALMGIPQVSAAAEISLRGTGRVETVDAQRKRFVIHLARVPRPLTLGWNEETQFLRGKESATAAILEPGKEIEIRYRISSNGTHHATSIAILQPSAADAVHKP
jgi:hypothetical protein